jgi:hypothetical protein
VENSEILRLIQQSLQMDQERNEMSRALQHHHDTFIERHITDNEFSNIELNDQDKLDEHIEKANHHQELAKVHEKNYEVYCINLLSFVIVRISRLANLVDDRKTNQ